MALQLENGYTRIANQLLEELAKIQLSGYQWRCILFLWRKTYGFGKCEDVVSLSQWVEGTGIKKQHVCRTLLELQQRNIFTKIGNKFKFNKYYQDYKELPKMVTLPKMVIPVTKNGNKSLPKLGHTKERFTKETYTKEIYALFDDFWKEYPKKKAKEAARKVFVKLKPAEELFGQMLAALKEQKTTHDWQKENGKFIPYPATWLNNKRWEDETEGGAESSPRYQQLTAEEMQRQIAEGQ